MLKKIAVDDLRLGMHLHKLEGSWLQHPFWKTCFVLDDEDDLRRLRECGVAECWIDVSLGVDVEAPAAAAAAVAGSRRASANADDGDVALASPRTEVAAAIPPPRPPPVSMHAEIQRAAEICGRARGAVMAMFDEARLGRTIDAERCLPVVDEISRSVMRKSGALISLARLKTQDTYSYLHSVAVCALMVALARQLDLTDDECRAAGVAGLMHDVGKAVMPSQILLKPGRLTDDELAVIRTHPQRGFELLEHAHLVDASTLDVVLHHHERFDGDGYPHRLAGDAITRFARMGAVCDVYDAITSNRPYKAGWDPAEAIARMATWKGQFDPAFFSAFVRSVGIYPVGALVRLESGRLAVVVEHNAHALVSPIVKPFFSTRSQMPITPEPLDLSRPGCADRIVSLHKREAGQFPQIDALWAGDAVLRRMPRR